VPIKDFLTQQETFRVVVNPFSFGDGMNNNMALIMMLDNKGEGKGDLAEVLMLASMLNGTGNTNPFGNFMNNPMALIALSGKGGGSLKDIMMLQMLQGCNMAPVMREAVPAPQAE
jgi:hypothetical protein